MSDKKHTILNLYIRKKYDYCYLLCSSYITQAKYDETKILPETAREYEKKELHSEKFPYNLYLTRGSLKGTSRHEVEVCK